MTEQFLKVTIEEISEMSQKLNKTEAFVYMYLQTKSWNQTKTVAIDFSEIAKTLGCSKRMIEISFKVLINNDWINPELFFINNSRVSGKKDIAKSISEKTKLISQKTKYISQKTKPISQTTKYISQPISEPPNTTGLQESPRSNIDNIDLIDQDQGENIFFKEEEEVKTFSSNGHHKDEEYSDDIPF